MTKQMLALISIIDRCHADDFVTQIILQAAYSRLANEGLPS